MGLRQRVVKEMGPELVLDTEGDGKEESNYARFRELRSYCTEKREKRKGVAEE